MKTVKGTGIMATITDTRKTAISFNGTIVDLSILENGDMKLKVNNKLIWSHNINEFKQ